MNVRIRLSHFPPPVKYYLLLLLLFSAGNLFAAELLHQSNFTYMGAFKLPDGNFGSANGTFEYSSAFVTGNVYNDPVNGKSLFIAGYLSSRYVSNQVSIAQVTIPSSIKDPNVVGIGGLTTATVVQGFDDPINACVPGCGGNSILRYPSLEFFFHNCLITNDLKSAKA